MFMSEMTRTQRRNVKNFGLVRACWLIACACVVVSIAPNLAVLQIMQVFRI